MSTARISLLSGDNPVMVALESDQSLTLESVRSSAAAFEHCEGLQYRDSNSSENWQRVELNEGVFSKPVCGWDSVQFYAILNGMFFMFVSFSS